MRLFFGATFQIMIQGRETQADHVIITDERRQKLKLEMQSSWNL